MGGRAWMGPAAISLTGSAKVVGVSEEQNDPSANTAAFQAFVREAASGDPELTGSRSKIGIIIAAAAAVVIVVGLIVVLATQ
jgi:hypothetical protein